MAIKKKQLRDFLNDRLANQRGEIIKACDKIRCTEINRLLITEKRPIDWWQEFFNDASKVAINAHKIRDDIVTWSGPLYDLTYGRYLHSFEDFMLRIVNSVDVDGLHNATINKAYQERSIKLEQLENEYSKLQGVIDGGTAKQAYEYLKEVGFDLSEVVDEPKHELIAVKPNLEVLGLPETK